MGVKKILGFLIYIIPVVGGVVMMLEAKKGKTISGDILVGNMQRVHALFGAGTLIVDCATVEGGGLVRGLRIILGRGLTKKAIKNITEKKMSEGFLRRGAVLGARQFGRQSATRGILRGAGQGLKKLAGKSILGVKVGQIGIKMAENKIRNTTKNTLGALRGYRLSASNRNKIRKNLGIDIESKKDLQDITGSKNAADEKAIGKSLSKPDDEKLNQKAAEREDKIKEQQENKSVAGWTDSTLKKGFLAKGSDFINKNSTKDAMEKGTLQGATQGISGLNKSFLGRRVLGIAERRIGAGISRIAKGIDTGMTERKKRIEEQKQLKMNRLQRESGAIDVNKN